MKLKKILAVLISVMAVSVFVNTKVSAETYGDFEYSVYAGEVSIHKYIGSAESVEIPGEIDGKKVIGIGAHAFRGCSDVTEVVIPDSVSEIEDDAFECCNKLELIELDKNNKNYVWEDGALFDKENKIIKFIPKKNVTYIFTVSN